jgi:gamma-D-glutamyl-L-lysine dipeptidyl-peptidase
MKKPWLASLGLLGLRAWAEEPAMYVVAEPVADLRAEPKLTDGAAALKSPYDQDPLQESQLIYGERVKVLLEKGPWARVESVEQEEYTHADAWTGYPGWVLKESLVPEPAKYAPNAVVSAAYARMAASPSRQAESSPLPAGARVTVTFEKDAWARVSRLRGGDGWVLRKDLRLFSELPATDEARRASILDTARLFLREPYFWGGRAGHREGDVSLPSGMDCSGLVNIAYRVAGVDVPRDSHEQYRRARGLSSPAELKPGDLIFLAWTKNPEKVTHVMIYAGGDDVVEAVQDQNTVRQVSVKEKLGRPLKDIAVMEPVGDRLVYFGRLLPE